MVLFVNDKGSSCDPNPRLWIEMTQMMIQAQCCDW